MMEFLGPGEPDKQELHEFYQWKQKNLEVTRVKQLSKYFALACIMEFIIIFVMQSIYYPFTMLFPSGGMGGAFVAILDELFYASYYFLAFLPPYLLYAKLSKLSLRQFPLSRIDAPITLAASGISLALAVLANVVTGIILMFIEEQGFAPQALPESPASGLPMLLSILTTVLLAPVIEEITYRGILMTSLRPFGDGFAILTSAIIFGLIHGNIQQFPFAFMMGCILGYFVVKTNSIFTGIFIHFLNNAFATISEMLSRNLDEFGFYLYATLENGLLVLFGMVGIIYLIGIRKVSWRFDAKSTSLTLHQSVKAYFLTLPMLLVLGYTIFKIVWSFI